MISFFDYLLNTKVGTAYRLIILMKGLPDKSNKR